MTITGRSLLSRVFRNPVVQVGIAVLVLMLLFAVVLDVIVMPLYTRQGSEDPVPDVVGMTTEQAADTLGGAGFLLEIGDAKMGGRVPPGTILEQKPIAGSLAKPGRTVHVVPALAIAGDFAPDLLGLEVRDAQIRCRNAGLVCGPTEVSFEFSDLIPKNYVIQQEPLPGTEVEAGSPIRLVVSLGVEPEAYIVPQLVDKNLHEARQLLTESGLALGRLHRKETLAYSAGTVIFQSVRSGTEVDRGTKVDLVVAVTKRETGIPDSILIEIEEDSTAMIPDSQQIGDSIP